MTYCLTSCKSPVKVVEQPNIGILTMSTSSASYVSLAAAGIVPKMSDGADVDIETQGHANPGPPREDQPLLLAPGEAEALAWKTPPGFVWIQVAIMSNVFLYGFDGTITAATYAVISSEFDAANTASWLTTSYLVTSTAFQPLYGRISDIFGRRLCFFISTITFALGCLGCGVANNSVLLNCMRALTGFGGGGLMTMGMRFPCKPPSSQWFSLLTPQSNYCQF